MRQDITSLEQSFECYYMETPARWEIFEYFIRPCGFLEGLYASGADIVLNVHGTHDA